MKSHSPQVTVLPIHFEDRSGPEFERLCFAYLLRAFAWKAIDWYGQLGGDSGRDIWGVRETGATECFQCANHGRLKFKKAEEDLAKLVDGPNGLPTKFTLITGGKVSAAIKAKVKKHAISISIREAEVWSGPEFEERLRRDEPLLVQRFVEGVPFPETVDALKAMTLDGEVGDDEMETIAAKRGLGIVGPAACRDRYVAVRARRVRRVGDREQRGRDSAVPHDRLHHGQRHPQTFC